MKKIARTTILAATIGAFGTSIPRGDRYPPNFVQIFLFALTDLPAQMAAVGSQAGPGVAPVHPRLPVFGMRRCPVREGGRAAVAVGSQAGPGNQRGWPLTRASL
jgi:hypothetical protein